MKPRNTVPILTAAVVVIGAVWFLHWLRHRDERQIRRALQTIVAQVSKRGPEGEIVALAKAAKIASFFTESPDIVPPPPIGTSIRDLDVLRGMIHQTRLSLEKIDIRILEGVLDIDKERGTATMEVEAQVGVDYAGERVVEIYRFKLGWMREDGRWRIGTVRTPEAPGDAPGFPSM